MKKASRSGADRWRRELLRRVGAIGLFAALAGQASTSAGGLSPGKSQSGSPRNGKATAAIEVAQRGVYASAPLRQTAINVCAIQSRVRSVDLRNLDATVKANLAHDLTLIDQAQGSAEEWGGERLWGSKQDLICLHEHPIEGFQPWTRKELERVAFDLPGRESEAIGAKARKYGCYIAFGCYARDRDWPRHAINMSVIVGPTGEIIAKHWKARSILGLFGDNALLNTTVFDVLDRYVEMYGWDAVLPVARTDIGNIAMTSVGGEPMLYTALAMKGAELLIMTVTGGNNPEAAIQTAKQNRIYTVGVGNSVSYDNIGFAEGAGAEDGGTTIVDPRGTQLAQSSNHHEDVVSARVPIDEFRRLRRFPEFPMALLLPVFQQYRPRYAPNFFLEQLPENYREAGDLVRKRMGG